MLASARAESGYKARPLGDGDRLEVGEIVFDVMQTPGHTPEHISILVTDRSRGDEPALLLSGGALLVSDVARRKRKFDCGSEFPVHRNGRPGSDPAP